MLKQMEQNFLLDLNKKLNIAYINVCTEAEGPYKRMGIWFQGCNINCKGCCNPDLQELKLVHPMTVQDILKIALLSKKENGIEGVTFLGGEPTLQQGLIHLAYVLKNNDFGMILFTGREYNDLESNIKNIMDIIIDGKFEIDKIDEDRNLVGSKNQNIIFITDRYKNKKEWFYNLREKRIEINMKEKALITGDVI